MSTPGKRIKKLRKDMLNMSQLEFGKLAEVTKSAVSQWEREITIPERDPLLALQRNRNINPEWIKNGRGAAFFDKNAVRENKQSYMEVKTPGIVLSESEREIIMLIRNLTPEQREFIRVSIRIFTDKHHAATTAAKTIHS